MNEKSQCPDDLNRLIKTLSQSLEIATKANDKGQIDSLRAQIFRIEKEINDLKNN